MDGSAFCDKVCKSPPSVSVNYGIIYIDIHLTQIQTLLLNTLFQVLYEGFNLYCGETCNKLNVRKDVT